MSRLTNEERAFLWRAIDAAYLTANVDELILDALTRAAQAIEDEANKPIHRGTLRRAGLIAAVRVMGEVLLTDGCSAEHSPGSNPRCDMAEARAH